MDFTEDDRRLIVAVREHLRYLDRQPPSRWLDAIHSDRETEDYANDPDAWNGPLRMGDIEDGGRD